MYLVVINCVNNHKTKNTQTKYSCTNFAIYYIKYKYKFNY